jgi:hypothetical protein
VTNPRPDAAARGGGGSETCVLPWYRHRWTIPPAIGKRRPLGGVEIRGTELGKIRRVAEVTGGLDVSGSAVAEPVSGDRLRAEGRRGLLVGCRRRLVRTTRPSVRRTRPRAAPSPPALPPNLLHLAVRDPILGLLVRIVDFQRAAVVLGSVIVSQPPPGKTSDTVGPAAIDAESRLLTWRRRGSTMGNGMVDRWQQRRPK